MLILYTKFTNYYHTLLSRRLGTFRFQLTDPLLTEPDFFKYKIHSSIPEKSDVSYEGHRTPFLNHIDLWIPCPSPKSVGFSTIPELPAITYMKQILIGVSTSLIYISSELKALYFKWNWASPLTPQMISLKLIIYYYYYNHYYYYLELFSIIIYCNKWVHLFP